MKKRIVSVTLALCLALSLLPVNAWAATVTDYGTCGADISWELNSEGVLTFSGSGEMITSNPILWLNAGKDKEIKTVIIGEGITNISDYAFLSCSSLSHVELPNSLRGIGRGAFMDCTNLAEIEIPPTVTTIGERAFFKCSSLVSVTIPSGVKDFGEAAFEDCYSLRSVVIEEGVDSIGKSAFIYCGKLTSVSIPSSVTTIGTAAFTQCYNLTSIIVDKDNTAYTSLDGVVFTKDFKTLVAYPIGDTRTTYTVPAGVTKIDGRAIQDCANLTSIVIPASVTDIGFDALFMGSGNSNDLRDIYYVGTKEQWEKIQFLDDPGGRYDPGQSYFHKLLENLKDDVHYIDQYTVSYDANGGTGTMADTIVGPSDAYKFPACGFTAPAGKSFKAWGVNGAEYAPNTAYTVTADTTVYAQWKDTDGYDITFDGNGGKFSSGLDKRTQRTGADGKLKEKPEEPAQTGHIFAGWFTSAAGGEERNDAYQFTADTTVYAQWKDPDNPFAPIDPVTITFNANGGSGGTTMKTGTDGKLSSLPRDPVRSGYTFDGWYFDAAEGLKIYTSTVFRANTTVYAHWTQNSSSSTNPSNPSSPADPGTPSGGSYQIVTPGSVYGGSYYVSHTSAPAGTVITIQVSPWSNYTLGQLTVTRTDTSRTVYTTRYGSQYTFTMPDSDVRLTITYNPSYTGGYVPSQPATASRYVNWYYSGGNTYHVTSGLVPTGSALTRDMFISILYNLDGSGSGDRDPTIWAATNDIVPDIIMSELWGADKSITREQTAMILYCYAQYKGYSTSQTMSLSSYRDARQIRSMAVPAMAWCCATGLMTGTSANTLSPLGTLTCGQANVIISRFLSGVVR